MAFISSQNSALGLLLLCLVAASFAFDHSKSGFLLRLPHHLRAGSTNDRACFTQLHQSQPATQVWLRLYETKIPQVGFDPHPHDESFLLYSTNATIFSAETSDVIGCFKINLPESVTASLAAVRVDLFDGDGHHIYPKNDIFNRTHPDLQVFIQPYEIFTLITTDKPRYRPRDTVHFQLLQAGQLRPVDSEVPEIWVTNPAGIRMTQWRHQRITKGLLQKHFGLAADSSTGVWTIHLKTTGKVYTKPFTVEEYTPPIFEIEVHSAKHVSQDQKTFTVIVCPRYLSGAALYNHNVSVSITGSYSRSTEERVWARSAVCHPIDVSLPYMSEYGSQKHRTVEVIVWDLNFQVRRSKVFTVQQKSRGFTNINLQTRSAYVSPKLPIFVQASVKNESNLPVVNEILEICLVAHFDRLSGFANYTSFLSPSLAAKLPDDVTNQLNQIPLLWKRDQGNARRDISRSCREFMTNTSGTVNFKFPSQASNLASIELNARLLHQNSEVTSKRLTAIRSLHGHYLVIDDSLVPEVLECEHNYPLKIATSLDKDELHPTMYYDVLAQNVPIFSGTVEGDSVHIRKVPRATSNLAVIVFMVMPSGDVVGDSKIFRVRECLPMQVSVIWDKRQTMPGKQSSVTVHGEPNAACAIVVTDRSTLLNESVHETAEPSRRHSDDVSLLTSFGQYSLLPPPPISSDVYTKHCTRLQSRILQVLKKWGAGDPTLNSTLNRMTTGFSNYTEVTETIFSKPYSSTLDAFEAVGYLVVSDFLVQNSMCHKYAVKPFPHLRHRRSVSRRSTFVHQETDIYQTRDDFPETHIFTIKHLDNNGRLVMPVTLPDSTTTWKATALCTGTAGFGKATDHISVSKPFYILVGLPYALKRGEVLEMKVVVYNLHASSLSTSVQLVPSPHYHLVDDRARSEFFLCIASGRSEVVTFPVTFTDLGKVNVTVKARAKDGHCAESNAVSPHGDIVTRSLLVKSKGFPQVETTSQFVCPGNEEHLVTTLELPKPRGVIPGTEQATFQVYGDLLAPTTQNVVKLIEPPLGGAEPNMMSFVSNVFVRSYLEAVGLLTDDYRHITENNIRSGYHRQLKYRKSDGSYSSFGEEDSEPSFWLTAFVVKSFKEASLFIDIDDVANLDSADWLLQRHDDHGCFRHSGSILHQEMKGGVDRDAAVSLTAYVILSLSGVVTPDRLTPAYGCINHALRHKNLSLYTQSLIAHTFMSVGLKQKAQRLIHSILTKATYEGDQYIYWQSDRNGPHGGRRAVDVEMTSYVVTTLLKLKKPDYFKTAKKAVAWLEKQRTDASGFESAQEIVTALEALAEFGRSTFTSDVVSHVVATPSEAAPIYITINSNNRLLFNQFHLPNVQLPSDVQCQVSGGCVTVQTRLRYSSTLKVPSPFFFVMVTSSEQGRLGTGTNYALDVCVATAIGRFKRPLHRVLLNVEMPSGFIPVPSTLRKLRDHREIVNYEIDGDTIKFTLTKIGATNQCIRFRVVQESVVEDLSEAVVSVHDFYQPERRQIAQYHL